MLKKMSKKKRILLGLTLLFIIFLAWVIWANTAPELNYITVTSADIPEEFSGYRIAHVSDFHNADMVEEMIEILKEADPDIIALTGDIVDSYHPDINTAVLLLKEAVKIAPCYYVMGNHETVVEDHTDYWEQITSLGVTVLQNERITLSKNGAEITVLGVDDPVFHVISENAPSYMEETLNELMTDKDGFTLLLSHRPELFSVYAKCGVNLVLSGHVHGGQFRLPLIGGLYAPNQGLFPEYDSGVYQKNGTLMVVSRGIGNSSFPLRFNNRPEVILVELVSEE